MVPSSRTISVPANPLPCGFTQVNLIDVGPFDLTVTSFVESGSVYAVIFTGADIVPSANFANRLYEYVELMVRPASVKDFRVAVVVATPVSEVIVFGAVELWLRRMVTPVKVLPSPDGLVHVSSIELLVDFA